MFIFLRGGKAEDSDGKGYREKGLLRGLTGILVMLLLFCRTDLNNELEMILASVWLLSLGVIR